MARGVLTLTGQRDSIAHSKTRHHFFPVSRLSVQEVELVTHFHGIGSKVSVRGRLGRQVTEAKAAPPEVWESFIQATWH